MTKKHLFASAKYYNKSGGYTTQVEFRRKFDKDSVKLYFNSAHLRYRLRPASWMLILHLCEVMDADTNEVRTDSTTIKRFLSAMHSYGITRQNGAPAFKESACLVGFRELRQQGMLITTPTRGVNLVNPRYFFRGTKEQRKTMLNKLLKNSQEEAWQNTNIFDALGF